MDHRLSPKDLPRAQLLAAAVAILGVLLANPAAAASTTGAYSAQPVHLFGIPVDFILFGLTLRRWAWASCRRCSNPDAPHKKRVEQDTRYQLAQTFLFERSQRHSAASKIGRRNAAFRDGLWAARVAEDGDAYS